jgi:ubiquinol-cytochrome c reductase cytochrome b subunit
MGRESVTRIMNQGTWGAWSLVSLYLSIVSGIIVALQYDPVAPFHSTTSLDALVPFGAFFRSLHFYSSQSFFLLLVVHFLVVLDKTDTYPPAYAIRLITTLPVALFLLFTGYILRGDSTGTSAGRIAEEIFKTIPLVGSTLNNFLFSITDHGMQRVYVHHIITFDVLWLVLAWDHLRRYRVRSSDHLWLIFLSLGFCCLIPAPLEPDKLGVSYIAGPWFFLGLQELLRYLHPLLAGLVFPFSFLIALCCLPNNNPYIRAAGNFTIAWLIFYGFLTCLALAR